MHSSTFLFTLCQVGAEAALKQELLLHHPELRVAYARPGFLTFKAAEPMDPDFTLESTFARAYGISLGRGNKSETQNFAKNLAQKNILWLTQRDRYAPESTPANFDDTEWLQTLELPQRSASNFSAAAKPLIYEIIATNPDEFYWGVHRHSVHHSPWPGGKPRMDLPVAAPSRAYLKITEAMERFAIPMAAEDIALELGSAPGGAVYALLERGLQVIGVDAAAMDPIFMRPPFRKRFQHIPISIREARTSDLPKHVDWLLSDMNVEPALTLAAIKKLLGPFQLRPKGLILTMKLNDWSLVKSVPAWLKQIKALGYDKIMSKQLFHNRQEFMVYATRENPLASSKSK